MIFSRGKGSKSKATEFSPTYSSIEHEADSIRCWRNVAAGISDSLPAEPLPVFSLGDEPVVRTPEPIKSTAARFETTPPELSDDSWLSAADLSSWQAESWEPEPMIRRSVAEPVKRQTVTLTLQNVIEEGPSISRGQQLDMLEATPVQPAANPAWDAVKSSIQRDLLQAGTPIPVAPKNIQPPVYEAPQFEAPRFEASQYEAPPVPPSQPVHTRSQTISQTLSLPTSQPLLDLSTEDDLRRRFGKDLQSALGPGSVIEGVFSFDTPVYIDGLLHGEVTSTAPFIVGTHAEVHAQVAVGSLVVFGTVYGPVEAEDLIEIRAGGAIQGDIRCKRLVVEDGGVFNGVCVQLDEHHQQTLM